MNQAKLSGVGLLIVRVVLGLIMMYYGSQKLFGLFGGLGFNGALQSMATKWNVPPLMAAIAMFAEFCGGLGLVLGLLTRVAAFGVMCAMATATYFQAKEPGVLSGIAEGNGINAQTVFFPLTLCAIALGLVLTGGGSATLEGKIMSRRRKVKQ